MTGWMTRPILWHRPMLRLTKRWLWQRLPIVARRLHQLMGRCLPY